MVRLHKHLHIRTEQATMVCMGSNLSTGIVPSALACASIFGCHSHLLLDDFGVKTSFYMNFLFELACR